MSKETTKVPRILTVELQDSDKKGQRYKLSVSVERMEVIRNPEEVRDLVKRAADKLIKKVLGIEEIVNERV